MSRLYLDLRSQQVRLRLERAEAETLLERRKGTARSVSVTEATASEATRKDIRGLEERIAVLGSRQRALDEELERFARERREAAVQELDLEGNKLEIAQIEDTARKIVAEVEALTVELEAPPRIRVIDEAAPTGS